MAIAGIALWVVGIPLATLFSLRRHRHAMYAVGPQEQLPIDQRTAMARYGSLAAGFHFECVALVPP